jgi:recombination protein RecA
MTKTREFLSKVKGEVVEQFGDGSAFVPSDTDVEDLLSGKVKQWIKPGTIKSLDAALGRGGKGLPCGRIIELFGPEGQGKSSLLYHIIGQCQKQDGVPALIDTELSFDETWARKLGVDLDNVMLFPFVPGDSSVEKYMDMLVWWVGKVRDELPDAPILVGWDTIWCTPTAELQGKSFQDKRRVASLARVMSQCLPDFNAFIAKQKVCLILVNQIRDNVGVTWGDSEVTPGGRAIKHMCSVRARVKRTAKLEGSGNIYSRVVNVKNKVSKPHQEADFKIDQLRGIVAKPVSKKK